MNLTQKYNNGSITIKDISPDIDSAGKALADGYVMFPLRTITEQIHTIEGIWGGMHEVLESFQGSKNYVRRLYRTRKKINQHFEPQPEPNP